MSGAKKKIESARTLDHAFEQRSGKATANHVFIVMARRGNSSGRCFMSHQRIADETGASLRTVGRAIKHLKNEGLILEIAAVKGRRTKHYLLSVAGLAGRSGVSDRPCCLPQTGQIDPENQEESKVNSGDPAKVVLRSAEGVSIGKLTKRLFPTGA